MEYNEDACVDFVRMGLSKLIDEPRKINSKKNYGRYDLNEIKNRIFIGINGSPLIEAYCGISDIDVKRFKQKVLEVNLPFFYRLNYKKVMNIKKINNKWVLI